MSLIILLLLAAPLFFFTRFVLGLGDDLNGWRQMRNAWRGWKRRRGRRNSPYIYVAAGVAVVYLLFTQTWARVVGWFGLLTAGKASWALTSWAMSMWYLCGLIGLACVGVQQMRRRRHYMGGEEPNPRGLARAAMRQLAREAVADALASLRRVEGQCPVPGTVDYFTVTIAGKAKEYGLRVRLRMKHGMTIQNLRSNTSDGMDPENDRLATDVTSSMITLAEEGNPEARRLLAYTGRRVPPEFPYTAVSPIYTRQGKINPAMCDLLLLQSNPLEEVHRYPKQRPEVEHLGQPIPVGFDIRGRAAAAVLREQMTGVFGMTGSGKSFYALNLAIGASQCRNVAFVVIDMKGRRGDMMSLAPRAAAAVHDHEGASVVLDWLVKEMDRRANRAGDVGKITAFTADMPEIVVWSDEWHEWTYDIPTKEAASKRMQDAQRLVRRARAFGIYKVSSTQIAAATGANSIPTALTGQFQNKVSTRLGMAAHTGMVFPPGTFTPTTGPHHIPEGWKGVAYGQFGDGGRIQMIRSFLSGPEVAARWAERDAKAGLNVPLPGLAAALEAAQPSPTPVLATVGAPAVRGGAIALDDLPERVYDAALVCWRVTGEVAPEAVTAKQLEQLSLRAGRKVHNRKGVSQEERDEVDAHRETIRLYTHPQAEQEI